MPYASGSDLTDRYDIDLIGDLSSDDRTTQDRSAVPNNSKVAAALDDASGQIDVALLSGGRYTPSQLAGLSGYSLAHLKRITCDIAMALLLKRRPDIARETRESITKEATEHLVALAKGENVFGIQAVIDSGVQNLVAIQTTQIERLNLLPQRMGRYFPGTDQRMPNN